MGNSPSPSLASNPGLRQFELLEILAAQGRALNLAEAVAASGWASMRRNTARSSACAVAYPPATPALAITRSGTPLRCIQSCAMACMAAASATSSVYNATPGSQSGQHFQLRRVPAHQCHLCALRQQPTRQCLAQAAAGACQHNVVKNQRHGGTVQIRWTV